MAKHQLLLPKMGESVSEATVIKWLKNPGDRIEEDDAVLEIATDKVDSDVPSPVRGILVEKFFNEDDVVQVGEVLAIIETDEGSDDFQSDVQPKEEVEEEMTQEIPGISQVDQSSVSVKDASEVTLDFQSEDRFYSPLVKSIAIQEGIKQEELSKIPGTGIENRLTKQDILNYVKNRNQGSTAAFKQNDTGASESKAQDTSTSTPVPVSTVAAAPAAKPAPSISVGPQDEIIEMDRMRRLISDHMVNSKQVSPHVCSIVEADVTNIVNWRNKVKDAFEKREGVKITFTPIFIEAVTKAIKDFPLINVSVDGYKIIKRKHINIGMATALPSGNLIVPVIKQADQLSLVGLSKSVNDLAKRARANKLKPDDTQGGTFTLTNIGAFGNLMGTPIINQPQVAILAIGTIAKKPSVIETEFGDMIGIRHKMYLSLSYDHRVVDGGLGGMFVKRVADYLEAWDVNREI